MQFFKRQCDTEYLSTRNIEDTITKVSIVVLFRCSLKEGHSVNHISRLYNRRWYVEWDDDEKPQFKEKYEEV